MASTNDHQNNNHTNINSHLILSRKAFSYRQLVQDFRFILKEYPDVKEKLMLFLRASNGSLYHKCKVGRSHPSTTIISGKLATRTVRCKTWYGLICSREEIQVDLEIVNKE